MEQRSFGRDGKRVPVIGQGTWNIELAERSTAVAALRRGLELGLTHLDTAEMYGVGRVEELVAEVIAGRRDEVFLVSKVLPGNATHAGTVAACERSLTRLQTDYLDCYLLHWPGHHPFAETLAGFEELQRAGKIRSYGVSNFDTGELTEAVRLAGEGRLSCNQVLYHVGERAIEHAVLPWCTSHGIATVAYSPFGSGSFPGPRTQGGKALADVAERHGATPHQVALAFLLRHDGVFVIPKSTTIAHVEENAGAASVRLEADDIAVLEVAFPRGAPPRTLPML